MVLTLFEGRELEPAPTLFLATTVNVYNVPLRSFEMVHVVETVTHLLFCGCEVATYVVIGDPPFDAGLDQLTRASPRPPLA